MKYKTFAVEGLILGFFSERVRWTISISSSKQVILRRCMEKITFEVVVWDFFSAMRKDDRIGASLKNGPMDDFTFGPWINNPREIEGKSHIWNTCVRFFQPNAQKWDIKRAWWMILVQRSKCSGEVPKNIGEEFLICTKLFSNTLSTPPYQIKHRISIGY